MAGGNDGEDTPLVKGPADELDTPPIAADGAPPSPPRGAGQQLGRYLVLDRLGAGGMGEVYRAYDPELDRGVALKVLRRDREAGPDGEDRLLREAQALARLTHPKKRCTCPPACARPSAGGSPTSPTHPSVATTLSSLGGAYLQQGRSTQAEAVLREAIATWEASVGPEHPEIGDASVRLGRTLLALDRPADAIAPLERGGTMLGEGAPARDRFDQEIALALALRETGGDPARVAELARSAETHLRKATDATDDDRARLQAISTLRPEPMTPPP